MTTARSTFNQHNLKKGDKIFLFGTWNQLGKSKIEYFIQEYTVHSIGKKQCYLIIENDVMSKRTFYCESLYGISKTKENAFDLCNQLMNEDIEIEISNYEWRKNNYDNYSDIADSHIYNCKNAKREIIFNPFNR